MLQAYFSSCTQPLLKAPEVEAQRKQHLHAKFPCRFLSTQGLYQNPVDLDRINRLQLKQGKNFRLPLPSRVEPVMSLLPAKLS